MTRDSLVTIFTISEYDYWFSLGDESLGVKDRFEFVMDLMRIPGFEDIYGLLFQGQQMTIYKDVLVENGVMWYELRELKRDYLKSQRTRLQQNSPISMDGLKIAVFGYEKNKRVTMSLIKYLKSQGVQVGLFVWSMKWREYKRLRDEVDLYCVELLL